MLQHEGSEVGLAMETPEAKASADEQTIARGGVNTPRRLPASWPRMPRQSRTDSTDAFCASGATNPAGGRKDSQ
jgi:hypothetical protein